ncbi:chemotaxis protein CheW [Sphingomonas sp. HT-1]|uniref:chemotaxis protein CheW n=1 Tax=unclassified Sphingomonas TaxID=196159 RepID=UPI000315EE96|nr:MULTISPECIES: chemotaxis protein CheW [unclassified Sphingomonas]KTF69005.1 chemotaxis protein CheW [Sphingomonas sp. WG]
MAGTAEAPENVLLLRVGGQRRSLPAAIIREVTRLPRLTRVPHGPSALLGLANIRGKVVPVLSLAEMIERPRGSEQRLIVVEDGDLFALAVDRADQLTQAEDAADVTPLDAAALIAASTPPRDARRAPRMEVEDQQGTGVTPADTVALVVFRLAGQEFALPLDTIDEVLRVPPEVARMPHAEKVVVGSTAVRGELLPVLSLGALLAMPAVDPEARSRIVVARIGGSRVGLLVDAVRGIERVPETAIDPVPQVLTRGNAEARIQAICRLDDGRRLVSVLAAEHLLRPDITARLTQGSMECDGGEAAMDTTSAQFLLFRIGEGVFGVPIDAVEEVVALSGKLARLPKAPSFVKGVMNLRGAAVPVIDQAERFGEVARPGLRRRVIIVRIGDVRAGFAVDAASEIVRIASDALQPAPELGTEGTRIFEWVAALSQGEEIALIVSPRELLDGAEQDLLRGMAGAS